MVYLIPKYFGWYAAKHERLNMNEYVHYRRNKGTWAEGEKGVKKENEKYSEAKME